MLIHIQNTVPGMGALTAVCAWTEILEVEPGGSDLHAVTLETQAMSPHPSNVSEASAVASPFRVLLLIITAVQHESQPL